MAKCWGLRSVILVALTVQGMTPDPHGFASRTLSRILQTIAASRSAVVGDGAEAAPGNTVRRESPVRPHGPTPFRNDSKQTTPDEVFTPGSDHTPHLPRHLLSVVYHFEPSVAFQGLLAGCPISCPLGAVVQGVERIHALCRLTC